MKIYEHLDKIPDGYASRRVTPGCVLLEGGAFHGVFSSGVLDALMLADINLETAIGVSAGALNAYNYVAGAIGRSARVNLTYRHDPRWVGWKAMQRNHGIMGFDFLFGQLAQDLPIDREGMLVSERRLVAVATNCLTGKPAYFEKDCGCIEQAVRASASMPIISKMVDIQGEPYLDGGCSNRLPLDWVLEQGFDKIIVVRTKVREFRREEKASGVLKRLLYRKYPEFLAAMERSNVLYNQTCDQLEQLERAGRLLVLYPTGENSVGHLEGDMEKLGRLYFEGLETTNSRMEEIKRYLTER